MSDSYKDIKIVESDLVPDGLVFAFNPGALRMDYEMKEFLPRPVQTNFYTSFGVEARLAFRGAPRTVRRYVWRRQQVERLVVAHGSLWRAIKHAFLAEVEEAMGSEARIKIIDHADLRSVAIINGVT